MLKVIILVVYCYWQHLWWINGKYQASKNPGHLQHKHTSSENITVLKEGALKLLGFKPWFKIVYAHVEFLQQQNGHKH